MRLHIAFERDMFTQKQFKTAISENDTVSLYYLDGDELSEWLIEREKSCPCHKNIPVYRYSRKSKKAHDAIYIAIAFHIGSDTARCHNASANNELKIVILGDKTYLDAMIDEKMRTRYIPVFDLAQISRLRETLPEYKPDILPKSLFKQSLEGYHIYWDTENIKPEARLLRRYAYKDKTAITLCIGNGGGIDDKTREVLQDFGARCTFKMTKTMDNYADYKLAWAMGLHHSSLEYKHTEKAFIISRDKGFDCLIPFLKERNVLAYKVDSMDEIIDIINKDYGVVHSIVGVNTNGNLVVLEKFLKKNGQPVPIGYEIKPISFSESWPYWESNCIHENITGIVSGICGTDHFIESVYKDYMDGNAEYFYQPEFDFSKLFEQVNSLSKFHLPKMSEISKAAWGEDLFVGMDTYYSCAMGVLSMAPLKDIEFSYVVRKDLLPMVGKMANP